MWRIDFPNDALKHYDVDYQEKLLGRISHREADGRLESIVILSSARMLRFTKNKSTATATKPVYFAMRFGAFNPPAGTPLAASTEVSECVPAE